MDCKELHAQFLKFVADARAIEKRAKDEGREVSAEETAKQSELITEAEKLQTQINDAKATEERSSKLAAFEAWAAGQSAGRRTAAEQPGTSSQTRTYMSPFDRRGTDEYRSAFQSYLCRGGSLASYEQRGLEADTDALGGYLIAPMQLQNELLKNLDNAVMIRQWADKFTLRSAKSLGIPTLDTDFTDATWTTELATGSEDTSMRFGRRSMTPHPLAKLVKVSAELIIESPQSAEALVRERLGYTFAVTQEKAFLTGTGSQQPLGVMTASNDGVPTSRDVSTGNTTTAFTADGLRNALYSLKEGHQSNARWLFHRDAMLMLTKLKDGNGQYLWQPGLQAGAPNMLLGRPVHQSEYMSNTFTTGLYVGIVGNFKYYRIVDSYDLSIKRLEELYAVTNQIGFIGRLKCDGAPVLSEAFARVKLA